MNVLSNATVLVTGGSGSFGNAFVRRILSMEQGPRVIRILSRDELKQAEMRQRFNDDHRLRWFLGDVRDEKRLRMAFEGCQIIIHAAALKRVEACEYNPAEAVQTNIQGTWNVIMAAIASEVPRVLALSSDKACAPVNAYGCTKAVLEKLVLASNAYSGEHTTKLSVVRYGNVAGSRGSVIPLWRAAVEHGQPIPVLDPRATRFWFTLDGAVDLARWTLNRMSGGELVVPKLPSFKITDLAEALAPGWPTELRGRRNGDKAHESMVSADEGYQFRDYEDHLIRFPEGQEQGECLPEGFSYRSDNNPNFMSVEDLSVALKTV